MISSTIFMNAYEKFYSEMRNYLWDVQTLEKLADVQIETYKAFIDVDKLEHELSILYNRISSAIEDDEYLKEAYENLKSCIEDSKDSTAYYNLYKLEEA